MNNDKEINTLFELLENHTVEIPKIQRDYAQGRKDPATEIVRQNLLSDIKGSILQEKPPLDLNFIYGKTNDENKFIPLDGQQRLTTLFLLHVYAYFNDEEKTPVLLKFTYDTRKSSRDFLEQLVIHRKEIFSSPLDPSLEIEDSEWFVSGWRSDPTIQSALVMLDAIKKKFEDIHTLAESLSRRDVQPIVFKFLDIEKLGMEDSLYIKLNARGKPLTQFENFKARLLERLDDLDIEFKEEFGHLVDGKWTQLFWKSHKKDFDRTFLAFFRVLLMNHTGKDTRSSNWANAFNYNTFDKDLFEKTYYTLNYLSENPNDRTVHNLIFNALPERGTYSDRVLFHTITTYFHRSEGIEGSNIYQWLRILKNLTLNSQIDDFDPYKRAIASINELADHWVDLLSYFANDGKVSGFSSDQISEENIKARLIQKSDDFASAIYEAEKHPYFSGQIRSALYYAKDAEGDHNLEIFHIYWEKISALFDESKPIHDNLLRQAMLTFEDYTLPVGDYRTLCVNDPKESESTPSMKRLFSDHSEQVKLLLDSINVSNNIESQLERTVSNSTVPANDWRYCFIQYSELFKLMSVGNLRLREVDDEMIIVPNKSSSGYNHMVFLQALYEELRKRNIEAYPESERGTWAEHWMWLGSEEKGVYAKYKDGAFTIYRGIEENDEDNELLFTTETNNPINEVVNYITEMLFP